MGVIRLPSGNYRAKFMALDGGYQSKTFNSKLEAEEQIVVWKKQKQRGIAETKRSPTFSTYAENWFEHFGNEASDHSGWRKMQRQYVRDYLNPVIGFIRLEDLQPQQIQMVFVRMAKMGLSPETQRLVFATARKFFEDATEVFRLIPINPVHKRLKPKTPKKEVAHLTLEQARALLLHVDGKPYGLAIWIQLLLGLRVGELMALKWEDVDLDSGRVVIRRTYVTKNRCFRDFPKGGRQHAKYLTPDLIQRLSTVKRTSEFIATSTNGNVLHYKWYCELLKRYCQELKLPLISTHGLRHSTAEIYSHFGATKDDLRRLFAHSTPQMTDLYVHERGGELQRMAKVINLFQDGSVTKIGHATGSGRSEVS